VVAADVSTLASKERNWPPVFSAAAAPSSGGGGGAPGPAGGPSEIEESEDALPLSYQDDKSISEDFEGADAPEGNEAGPSLAGLYDF
jgi:hypothetical protein